MCLSASGDLYWLPPGPSPVGALTGIWSSLWEKKEPFCPACRVWIVTTSAVILTGLTVSSLLDLVKALCLQQCPDEGASGASGCQPCPACARALCPASPGPSAGREGALARGTGESSAGLSSGCCSAPRQKARLNLHLDMLVFEQETFILLQGSTPVTLIFCTCWLKQKTSDGQGGCWRGCAVTESCIWTGIAYCGLVWFCSSRGFFIFRQNSLQAILGIHLNWMGLPSSPCLAQRGCVLWQSLAFTSQPPSPCCGTESCSSPALPQGQALFSACVALLLIPWNE